MLTQEIHNEISEAINTMLDNSRLARCQCVTVKDAAALLCCKPDTIRVYIESGKLKASKPGKEYVIQLHNLEAFIEANSNLKNVKINPLKTA